MRKNALDNQFFSYKNATAFACPFAQARQAASHDFFTTGNNYLLVLAFSVIDMPLKP
jgi:hypothetical protein